MNKRKYDESIQGSDKKNVKHAKHEVSYDLASHSSPSNSINIGVDTLSNLSPSQPHDSHNIPKSISPLAISPWQLSSIPTSLPPLPAILDQTLEKAVFIHSSFAQNATDLSYERLEWVGDAYIYLTSTLLISQTFPALLPGKCSQTREMLVKNVTLAEYARQYGFEERAKLPDEILRIGKHAGKEADITKTLGDIFEAYVAAVILSDPVNGVTRASEWLKSLWSMTIRKKIKEAEERGQKLDSPMWRLRGGAEAAGQKLFSVEPTSNAKEILLRTIGARGIKITYKDVAPEKKDKETKLPLFTVGVYLDGWGERDKQLGWGRAHGKKDAGMKAAEMALANKAMMNIYKEKKKLFDAQLALEREAEERHKNT